MTTPKTRTISLLYALLSIIAAGLLAIVVVLFRLGRSRPSRTLGTGYGELKFGQGYSYNQLYKDLFSAADNASNSSPGVPANPQASQ